MTKDSNSLVLLPAERKNILQTNDDGLFNASSIAKEYKKDVYGYTRGQKVKELINAIALEYGHEPDREFTERGNIVRVISGGTAPGTWMHLDIFIKFLGWLDPKLERDFLKNAITANQKTSIDPLQEELAQLEANATALRRKLSRVPFYKQLQQVEKDINRVKREIEKESKAKRKQLSAGIKKEPLLIGNSKQ